MEIVTHILLDGHAINEQGVLELHVNREIVVNLLADEAQRKVNKYVHMEISTQMRAEKPVLVVGDRIVWQVPVHLTLPAFGDVGRVGVISVDPVSGELDVSPATLHDLVENAENTALRFTSSATFTS